MMTDAQLKEYEERSRGPWGDFEPCARVDVRELVAEVRRLQANAELLRAEKELQQPALDAQVVQIDLLRADLERIGHERDQMVAANVELQDRLSRLEDDRK